MSKYLDQFPPDYHAYVRSKFHTAYVFEEQSYDFGVDDVICLAQGPKEMKARLVNNLEKLLALGPTDEQRTVIEQMLTTVDSADEFLREVKQEIDRIWKQSREYYVMHPRKDKKKADPPSEKQLSYLKSLGCEQVPKTKAEATRLIDKYKNL